MPTDSPIPPNLERKFKRVREARELLRQRAAEIIDKYIDNAVQAQEAGKYEVAAESFQWLIEHMPADEETGDKLVDTSVDKQAKQVERAAGPTFNLGFVVGGMSQPALPAREAPKVLTGEVVVKDKK